MIVVDASVAAKWILPEEEHAARALALVTTALEQGEPVLAPPFLPVEVTNILRQRMRREGLDLRQGTALLRQFLALPITLLAPATLYEQALILADTYALAAVYDAHYVALAQAVGCDLWTADQRLVTVLSRQLPFVRWLGDYPEEAG